MEFQYKLRLTHETGICDYRFRDFMGTLYFELHLIIMTSS